jgi:superfamily II DNA or RNA helicase
MELKSTLQVVSPSPTFQPRNGQQEFLNRFVAGEKPARKFSGQFPTGYGKTIIAAMAFRALVERGLVNRMLLIVANNQQQDQAHNDFGKDCKFVGLNGVQTKPFSNSCTTTLANERGHANVFIATIQSVSRAYREDKTCIEELITKGDWFIVADEYHHYGEGRDWGSAVQSVCKSAVHYLALSATPFNRAVDTIFGAPDFVWTYRQALQERAVKPFELHSARYDLVLVHEKTNQVEDTTTCELRQQKDPDVFIKKKTLRYDSRYTDPILCRAIESLIEKQSQQGGTPRLQMLVRAHGCVHAKFLKDRLEELTGKQFSVDWVGSARQPFENDDVFSKFVPEKDSRNRRKEPTLDILVQVAMCGEGSDTVNVVEIVDLSFATFEEPANADRQFIGRGARVIRDENGEIVRFNNASMPCNVWVPSDSPIAKLYGSDRFREWIDNSPLGDIEKPAEAEPDDDSESQDVWRDLVINTKIFKVENCMLSDWLEGEDFKEYEKDNAKQPNPIPIDKNDKELMQKIYEGWERVYRKGGKETNAHNEIERCKMQINDQVRKLANRLIEIIGKKAERSKYIGIIIERINAQIKRHTGLYRSEITSVAQAESALLYIQNVAKEMTQTRACPAWIN